jgi:hypothetical protein
VILKVIVYHCMQIQPTFRFSRYIAKYYIFHYLLGGLRIIHFTGGKPSAHWVKSSLRPSHESPAVYSQYLLY